MSQPTTNTPLKPWEVDANPDFFGVHLLVDGRRFFIPKERLEAVIVALSVYREKPPIADWLDDDRAVVAPALLEEADRFLSAGQGGE